MTRLAVNNHHEWFNRREHDAYVTTSLIRNHEQSQIRLPVEIHNNLHKNIDSMPIPSLFVARQALEFITTSKHSSLDTTKGLIDYMQDIGSNYHKDALEVSDHLKRQLPFLILGTEALKRRHL